MATSWLTVAEGHFWVSIASAPATCGAAIEVPFQPHCHPSADPSWSKETGTAEQMSVPGASRSSVAAVLEPPFTYPKTASTPPLAAVMVVLPTLTALLLHAGQVMPL
jgi:hypothetical protein